jgi:DNA-binding transcriptional regulator GbsR (MarR family)
LTADHGEVRRHAVLDRLSGMLEVVGFPHNIARVYSALTLAEGEGMSTTEIMDELGTSKASVSNAMQFLVGTDLVERYRVRGSREAHYRMLQGKWGDVLARKFAGTSSVRAAVEEALEFTSAPRARERLSEMHEVYSFFEREFADVMQRFNERK